MKTIPVSAVVATRNRPRSLARMLESMIIQEDLPAETIIVDASTDSASRNVVEEYAAKWTPTCTVVWLAATQTGAAVQRNQGVARTTQAFVCFLDDDILFERRCLMGLWQAISANCELGGVSAMIVNQRYQPPGFVSRAVFTAMHGQREKSFAGRVIGPAVNLLPEDGADLPPVVSVEWLNLGCTIYRREALPSPPFDLMFTGYSIMEDLTLSLRVAKSGWKLANVRNIRIFHDSQPGAYKADPKALAMMELVNRHYVMINVLGRRSVIDYLKLAVWELFSLASVAADRGSRKRLPAMLSGKWKGFRQIVSRGPAI